MTSAISQTQLMRDLRLYEQYMTPEEKAEFQRLLIVPSEEVKRYRNDPVAFAKEILRVDLAPYQERVLNALRDHRRVCVRGPHGMGKTTISAICILWFITTREECKIPTTASAWRQLTQFLWPEIHKWALKAKDNWWRLGIQMREGVELLRKELKLGSNRFAYAVASSDEAKIEGAHSTSILYVFDESKAIEDAIWDAAEGALSTGDAYALAVSTPGDSIGRFYDIQVNKNNRFGDWHVIHVTDKDAIAAGRMEEAWIESRKIAWGETSVMFQRRCKGNFCDDDAETVIPIAAIEAAQERWRKYEEEVRRLIDEEHFTEKAAIKQVWGPLMRVGVDPSGGGEDKSGFAWRHQNGIREVERTVRQSIMETTGKVKMAVDTHEEMVMPFIDANGLGAGVCDRLREQGIAYIPIQVSSRCDQTDTTGYMKFYQYRDWLWWNMRDILMAPDCTEALPPDDELTRDLLCARYTTMSNGRIKVSDKEAMHKLIGRSPDAGEAVLYAYGIETSVRTPLIGFV